MSFTKPPSVNEWDTNLTNVVTPDPSHQADGWANGEKPTAGFFNSLQNVNYQWFRWINERVDDGAILTSSPDAVFSPEAEDNVAIRLPGSTTAPGQLGVYGGDAPSTPDTRGGSVVISGGESTGAMGSYVVIAGAVGGPPGGPGGFIYPIEEHLSIGGGDITVAEDRRFVFAGGGSSIAAAHDVASNTLALIGGSSDATTNLSVLSGSSVPNPAEVVIQANNLFSESSTIALSTRTNPPNVFVYMEAEPTGATIFSSDDLTVSVQDAVFQAGDIGISGGDKVSGSGAGSRINITCGDSLGTDQQGAGLNLFAGRSRGSGKSYIALAASGTGASGSGLNPLVLAANISGDSIDASVPLVLNSQSSGFIGNDSQIIIPFRVNVANISIGQCVQLTFPLGGSERSVAPTSTNNSDGVIGFATNNAAVGQICLVAVAGIITPASTSGGFGVGDYVQSTASGANGTVKATSNPNTSPGTNIGQVVRVSGVIQILINKL